MSRWSLIYDLPEEMLTYLIGASVAGTPERQLAAKLLLECLRRFHTKEQVEACLKEIARTSILDIMPESKRLASQVGLFGEEGVAFLQ